MRYEPAGKNPTQTGCMPGTKALASAVKTVFPELNSLTAVYGCFNHRKIRGSTAWSLHAEGRAFDTGVPGRERETGWSLACELVANHIGYGVQRVIWDGHIWSIEVADRWRQLQPSTDQHHDHIHTEQYRAAAQRGPDTEQVYTEALARSRKH